MNSFKIVSLNVRSLANPARFRDLYNIMQSRNVDVCLAQEAFIDEEDAAEYEAQFPLVRVASNKSEAWGGVAILINVRTTEWQPPHSDTVSSNFYEEPGQGNDHVLFKDDEGRLLVCGVRCRGQPMVVGCVYAPAEPTARKDWFARTVERIEAQPPREPCDVLGGDWNEILSEMDHHNRRAPRGDPVDAMNRLVGHLGGVRPLIDGWRERHPDAAAFSFFRDGVGISRIDRVYVREDWMRGTDEWDIRPSGLQTAHHAATVEIAAPTNVRRGPGRWRLNQEMLKTSKVHSICYDALEALPGEDYFSEWAAYKTALREKLKEKARQDRQETKRLVRSLQTRRKNLWQQRAKGPPDPGIEAKLSAITIQEQGLEEWNYKSYAYNALAKHALLDETPSKWFFSKVKADSDLSIPALDEQGQEYTTEEGILGVAERFYGDLYSTKESDQDAAGWILSQMDKTLDSDLAASLTREITVKEVAASIRRTALGKSPGPNGLPYKLYKLL